MMQYNITIESGADFYLPLKLRDGAGDPIDLTGATITAQLREYPEAQDYFQFTTSHNGAGGRITLSMGHEATTQIGYTAGYYDVFVDYPDETREKVLWGEVTVQPNVTKPIAGTPMVVLSFASEEEFPLSGLTDRLYLSHASGKLYRWNGTTYVGTRAEIDWEDVKEKPETFPPAEHNHDDRYYTISEMDTALERKADVGDSYTKEEEDDLLSGKADADHTHEWDEIQDKPETFPPETHNHDDRYFTETETTTLLSGKADADHNHDGVYSPIDHNHDADYAAIDHTHDYSEIENTPILGDLAEKDTVDWDTDIDNIPTEFPPESHNHDDRYYTETETDDLLDSKASIIRTSASGSLVHLTDAAAMPVENLIVDIEPVQSGSGTPAPDNVRPISGHSTATVTRTGKNLLKMNVTKMPEQRGVTASYSESTGASYTGTFSGSGRGAPIQIEDVVIPAGTYTFSSENTAKIRVLFIDSNSNMIASIAKNTKSSTVTLSQPRTISRISLDGILGDETNFTLGHIQIEYGSTATAYAPYQGQTVTIDLNGTRYGGTVDVRTGVMTVDRVMVDMGTLDWTYSSNRMKSVLNDIKPCESTVVPNLTAEQYRAIKWSAGLSSNHDGIALNPTAVGTGYEVVVYAADSSNTPSGKLVYPLATPFTVQLTPAELSSLLYGTNNLWASTGDVNVGYRADTKLYIDRKITELQALILDN